MCEYSNWKLTIFSRNIRKSNWAVTIKTILLTGLSVASQPFLGSNIYKYTMFGLSIFGASSLVLLLMIKVFSIAMKGKEYSIPGCLL